MHRLRGRFNLCLDRFYLSLGCSNLALVDARLSSRVIGVRFRSDSAFEKTGLSRKLEPALLHVSLSLREICPRLFKLRFCLCVSRLIIRERALNVAQLRVKISVFEACNHLSRFYSASGINSEILEPPGDLRTDRGLAIGHD